MLETPSSGAAMLRPASSLEEGGYEISGFQLADAPDIPRAFEAVYGRDYLNPQVYDAAGFAAVVASGAQISFIARDAEGDFAGHLALVFSTPNPRLIEVAQGIVLPGHRKSGIFGRLMTRAVAFAREELGCQAVFGTALTNHAVSQKVLAHHGFRDVGLEIDYVPERMLRREGAGGPAATLVQYLDFGRRAEAPCHLPPAYAGWFCDLLDGAAIAGERRVVASASLDRRASRSEAKDMPRFDMARLLVRRAGFDFWRLVSAFEASAETAGRRSAQVLIDLGEAEGAAAVELLRSWGYSCGGLLPAFLDGGRHVAIMYRSFAAPYFAGVRLHAAPAEHLLACVVADWKRAQGLSGAVVADRIGRLQIEEARLLHQGVAANEGTSGDGLPSLHAIRVDQDSPVLEGDWTLQGLDAETNEILRALARGRLSDPDGNAARDAA